MTQEELKASLEAVTAQTEKTRTEIVSKLAELETAIQNQGNTTPEVDAALEALKAATQANDDLIEDAPAE